MKIYAPLFLVGIALSSCSHQALDNAETALADTGNAAIAAHAPSENHAAPSAAAAPAAIKKRVLMLPFFNRTIYQGNELTDRAQNEVLSALFRLSDVVVVNPSELPGFETFWLDETSYNWKAVFSQARAHGVSGVITGAVEEVAIAPTGESPGLFSTQSYRVDVKVRVEVRDVTMERAIVDRAFIATHIDEKFGFFSREIAVDDPTPAFAAISKALDGMPRELSTGIARLGWVGRIAKVAQPRYYINAGQETGLRKGELLKVFGEDLPVEDATTGTLLGNAPGRFKGVLRVVDFFGRDGAIAVLHSGADVREQDRVEVYNQR